MRETVLLPKFDGLGNGYSEEEKWGRKRGKQRQSV